MISDDYVEYVFDLQEIDGENILEIFKHRFGAVVSQLHLNYEITQLEDIQEDDDFEEKIKGGASDGSTPSSSTFPYNTFESFMDQITQLNGSVSSERSKIFNSLFRYDRRRLSKSILEPKSFIETNTKFLSSVFPKEKTDNENNAILSEKDNGSSSDTFKDTLLPDTLEADEQKKEDNEEPSLAELINIETPVIKEDKEEDVNNKPSDKDEKQEGMVSKGMTYLTSVFSAPKVEENKESEPKTNEKEESVKIPEDVDPAQRKDGVLSSGINYVTSLFSKSDGKVAETKDKLEQEKQMEEEKKEEEKKILSEIEDQKENVDVINEGLEQDKAVLEEHEQIVEGEPELSSEEKSEIEREREQVVKDENLLEEETEKLNKVEEKSQEINKAIETHAETVEETEKILEEEIREQSKGDKRSNIIKIRLVVEKKSGLTTLEIIKKGRLAP